MKQNTIHKNKTNYNLILLLLQKVPVKINFSALILQILEAVLVISLLMSVQKAIQSGIFLWQFAMKILLHK